MLKELIFLLGKLDCCELYLKYAFSHCQSSFDRVAVFQKWSSLHEAKQDFQSSIKVSVDALHELGIEFPYSSAQVNSSVDGGVTMLIQQERERMNQLLQGRTIESCIELPEVS